MTQRKWKTTDGWDVLTGWDRPLQHFFVTINRECRRCDGTGEAPELGEDPCGACNGRGNEFLYDNLDDTKFTDALGGMSIEQVKTVLDLKLTAFPRELMWDLLTDKKDNVGNLVVTYEPIGERKK